MISWQELNKSQRKTALKTLACQEGGYRRSKFQEANESSRNLSAFLQLCQGAEGLRRMLAEALVVEALTVFTTLFVLIGSVVWYAGWVMAWD